jgi:dienelactone hydrolase
VTAFTRRRLLTDARRVRDWILRRPDPFIPSAPEGVVRLETVHSAARGRDVDELPRWAARRGFDAGRLAGWGWSMGGFGVLHIAEVKPGFLRGAAAFSPAVTPGDGVFALIGALAGTPLGVWCRRDDPLYPNVRRLVAALPDPPGAHTRVYWDSVTLPALAFVGGVLGAT